jgi:hypothetical protein
MDNSGRDKTAPESSLKLESKRKEWKKVKVRFLAEKGGK